MASGLAAAASQERPEAVRVCCKKPPMRERATTIAVFSVCHLRSNSERMLPSALKRSQKHVSCTRRAPQIIDRAVPCSFLSFFPLGMNALSFSSVALSSVVFFRDRGPQSYPSVCHSGEQGGVKQMSRLLDQQTLFGASSWS